MKPQTKGHTMKTGIKNLDTLFEMMKNDDETLADWDKLPTFGGPEMDDTIETWSWDATRMIVGTCSDDIAIVEREDI